jgi:hypothetical protein
MCITELSRSNRATVASLIHAESGQDGCWKGQSLQVAYNRGKVLGSGIADDLYSSLDARYTAREHNGENYQTASRLRRTTAPRS